MNAEDWFGLGIRIVAVVIFVWGLESLIDAGLFKLGYFNYMESSPAYYLISGLGRVVAGFVLFRGAPLFVELAYPELDEDDIAEKQ